MLRSLSAVVGGRAHAELPGPKTNTAEGSGALGTACGQGGPYSFRSELTPTLMPYQKTDDRVVLKHPKVLETLHSCVVNHSFH
jgi:hypothetical protein